MAGFSNPFLQLIYFLTVFVLKKKVSTLCTEVSSFSLSHGEREGQTQVREGSPKFCGSITITEDLS